METNTLRQKQNRVKYKIHTLTPRKSTKEKNRENLRIIITTTKSSLFRKNMTKFVSYLFLSFLYLPYFFNYNNDDDDGEGGFCFCFLY